jgi:hypothetical protein
VTFDLDPVTLDSTLYLLNEWKFLIAICIADVLGDKGV